MLKFFMFILHSREIKNPKLLYTLHSFNTAPTPPDKHPGRLFEDWRFTVVLVTSEQNEYVLCLHQADLPYFLMCLILNFMLKKACN